MMILRSSPASPFGRKVKIAARLLGLSERIQVQQADPSDPKDSITTQNPLGKIPALILEDGACLYDSRVILEYLDSLSPTAKIIPPAPRRWGALTLAALADGMMEAALLLVYEKRIRPPETWSSPWMQNQQQKIDRGLSAFEANPPKQTNPPDVAQIGLACALGYLDLRHEGRWRKSNPKLVDWLDAFSKAHPVFEETRVKA